MKYFPYIAPWFFTVMLLALWLNAQNLLEKSWEREQQWKANVDKSLAAAESCHSSFNSLHESFQQMKLIAEKRMP